MHALTRERTEVDKALRQMARQLDRLLDAYQHGAISVEELKARRERLAELEAGTRARAEALTATEGERERLDRVTTDPVAFAATLRDGLAQLNFAGRERLVRLLIERVIVTGDRVTFAGLRTRDRGGPRPAKDPRAPGPSDGPTRAVASPPEVVSLDETATVPCVAAQGCTGTGTYDHALKTAETTSRSRRTGSSTARPCCAVIPPPPFDSRG